MDNQQVTEDVQKFAAEYQELCKKHGMQIVAMPVYIKRDDNTFSLVIQYQVEKIKE